MLGLLSNVCHSSPVADVPGVGKELNEEKCNETPCTCNLSMDEAQKMMGTIIKHVI